MADAESPDPIYKTEALIAEDIDAYLEQHQHKTMLRFITCGSVDVLGDEGFGLVDRIEVFGVGHQK